MSLAFLALLARFDLEQKRAITSCFVGTRVMSVLEGTANIFTSGWFVLQPGTGMPFTLFRPEYCSRDVETALPFQQLHDGLIHAVH